MKSEKLFFFMVFCCFMSGCAHQKNKSSASKQSACTLYELALVQMQEASVQDRAAQLSALSLLEQACAKHRCVEWDALRASMLMRLGRYTQAADCLKILIDQEKDPVRHAQLLNNYACVLVELKQPKCALELWLELVNNADYATPECAWYNSGKLYLMQNDKKQASHCFRQALAIVPSYEPSHRALALLLDESGEHEQAQWHQMVAGVHVG